MKGIKKYTVVLMSVLLVLISSVSVFATSKKDKSNCDCQINGFSVTVDGVSYSADGNKTYYIEDADKLNLEQISRAVVKDPRHTDAHPTELSYSFDDQSYQVIQKIGEGESSPVSVDMPLDFKGKTDIYFKLTMQNRNETASYIHLKTYPKYQITYDLNGGSMEGNPDIFTEVSDTFTLKNPVRSGYKFLGWTGTGLDVMSQEVTIQKGSTGDRTYTAHWEQMQTTATDQTSTQGQGSGTQQTVDPKKAGTDGKQKETGSSKSDVARTGDDLKGEPMIYFMILTGGLITMGLVIKKRRAN